MNSRRRVNSTVMFLFSVTARPLSRIAYSALAGLLVTILSSFLYRQGGEILAVPGVIIAGVIYSIAYYGFAGPVEFPQILAWPYYSFIFYSLIFYGASWAYTGLSRQRQRARETKGET